MSLAFLFLELEYAKSKKKKNKKLDAIDLAKYLHVKFNEKVMSIGESVLFQYDDKEYIFTVLHAWVDEEETSNTVERGIFTSDTNIVFETASDSKIKIINQRKTRINSFLWKKGFSLQKYGIGGLGEEFTKIFKRAFASRIFPPHLINRLGIKHVKGMVLYGPPGTGKTLMARQIGKLLTGREPKIVSGPEVLNKYVGQSAKNVRDLFADAEREQREKGDQSDLHIIIFDEIDSISKPRGTENGSSEKDNVVNQLLTKIDGVFALTNILVIGTTNRRDLLDEALLRPGRLEILVEFKLPDESGRLQILQIHTRKMKANSFLAEDVNLQELALRTENYSGAELESIVKVAVAVALNRQITVDDRTKELNTVNIKVTMDDLLNGFQEIIPAFGASTTDLQRCRVKGMIDCSERHKHVYEKTMLLVRLVKSNICQLCTCLLEGPQGSGKTSIAATIGIDSDFPYIKIVSAASMEGLNENGRCAEIVKVFQDAYKFQWSIIILDNIERLLDYAAIGPWYSNLVAQTLWRRLESLPPEGKNVLVIGTTSEVEFLKSVKLCSAFSVTYHVPALAKADVIKLLGHLNVFANDDIDAAAEALDGMTLKKIYSVIEIATVGKKEGNLETILSRKEKIDINYFLDILSDSAFT